MWALMQCDWYLFKKRETWTQTCTEGNNVKTPEEDPLQSRERGFFSQASDDPLVSDFQPPNL